MRGRRPQSHGFLPLLGAAAGGGKNRCVVVVSPLPSHEPIAASPLCQGAGASSSSSSSVPRLHLPAANEFIPSDFALVTPVLPSGKGEIARRQRHSLALTHIPPCCSHPLPFLIQHNTVPVPLREEEGGEQRVCACMV